MFSTEKAKGSGEPGEKKKNLFCPILSGTKRKSDWVTGYAKV